MKNIGKTTRPFGYNLNQIPYHHTVKVRNGFKELDLIDRVPEEYAWRFMIVYRRKQSRPSPKEKKCKKGKMVV